MRLVFVCFFLLMVSLQSAWAGSLENLSCKSDDKIHISHSTFQTSNFSYANKYLFKDGKLFTATENEPDFQLYNKFEETEPSRIISGHKVITFGDDFNEAVIVHTNASETYVVKIKCKI